MNIYAFLSILVVCLFAAFVVWRLERLFPRTNTSPGLTGIVMQKYKAEAKPLPVEEKKHEVKVDLREFEEDWRDEEAISQEP